MTTWADIDAETETEERDYRQALVASFRRHEGEELEERDKYNRPVIVTMASFARHKGIARVTFQRWCDPREMAPTMGAISTPAEPEEEPEDLDVEVAPPTVEADEDEVEALARCRMRLLRITVYLATELDALGDIDPTLVAADAEVVYALTTARRLVLDAASSWLPTEVVA